MEGISSGRTAEGRTTASTPRSRYARASSGLRTESPTEAQIVQPGISRRARAITPGSFRITSSTPASRSRWRDARKAGSSPDDGMALIAAWSRRPRPPAGGDRRPDRLRGEPCPAAPGEGSHPDVDGVGARRQRRLDRGERPRRREEDRDTPGPCVIISRAPAPRSAPHSRRDALPGVPPARHEGHTLGDRRTLRVHAAQVVREVPRSGVGSSGARLERNRSERGGSRA